MLHCAWISLEGVPACANKRLLRTILREEWNFTGYVVSDDDALQFMISHHHYVDDMTSAAVAAIRAGCNLELSDQGTERQVFRSITQVCSSYINLLPRLSVLSRTAQVND